MRGGLLCAPGPSLSLSLCSYIPLSILTLIPAQCPASLFSTFDRVLVLTRTGDTLFFGSPAEVEPYMARSVSTSMCLCMCESVSVLCVSSLCAQHRPSHARPRVAPRVPDGAGHRRQANHGLSFVCSLFMCLCVAQCDCVCVVS